MDGYGSVDPFTATLDHRLEERFNVGIGRGHSSPAPGRCRVGISAPPGLCQDTGACIWVSMSGDTITK